MTGRVDNIPAFGGVKGRTELPSYAEDYMNGKIVIDAMVTHQLPFEDINKAFDPMHEGKSIRSVITFRLAYGNSSIKTT